ncbi:uncharacterized protein LOC105664357 [Megachile rotundata]|uniref:uncharacterized protein LOC105664357 n=1 Tax=Megachile rotundata TaxID=143995 RepID=UPI003FD1CDD7
MAETIRKIHQPLYERKEKKKSKARKIVKEPLEGSGRSGSELVGGDNGSLEIGLSISTTPRPLAQRSDDPCRSGKSELQDHRSNISEHFNLRRASLAGKVQNNHKHGKDIVEKRALKNGNNDRREKGRTVNEVSRV